MTFAEFVEDTLDIHLPEWQAHFLNEAYRRIERGEKLYYRPARGSAKGDPILSALLLCALYKEPKENEEE